MSKIFSADGHIDFPYLPLDIFEKYGDPDIRDRLPKALEDGNGQLSWVVDGRAVFKIGATSMSHSFPKQGFSRRYDMINEAGFFDDAEELLFHAAVPALRVKDQELDELEGEVIYGVLGADAALRDPEVTVGVYRAYNRWLADFCAESPNRLVGLACIANSDPETAASMVREVSKLGLKGADFHYQTAAKPAWLPFWDPLWDAAQECGMPISFHATGQRIDTQSEEYVANQKLALSVYGIDFQMVASRTLAGAIFSGMCERFPGLNFVLGESGVGWIPYVLERMDEAYHDRYTGLVSQLPSNYWRRQGHTTFQNESSAFRMLDILGEKNIMWGADYPHMDSVWPESHQFIERTMGHLDEGVRTKITHDNAVALYGLDS